MRRILAICISVPALLSLCPVAQARVVESPTERYGQIPERNLFRLKGAPEESPAPAQAEPPTKLFLTGITTMLGTKRALLKEQPPAGKPVDPHQDLSLILAEGQREGAVEVLQIEPKAGKVKVSNAGVVQTLTFDKDGVKAPVAPAAPAAPPPLPTATSAPYPNPGAVQPGLSRHTLPSRAPRWPGTANSAAPTTGTPPTATGSIFPTFPTTQAAPAAQVVPTPTGSPTGLPESALPGTTPPEVQSQLQPELGLEQQVLRELQQEGQPNGANPAASSVPNGTQGIPSTEAAPADSWPNAPAVYPQ